MAPKATLARSLFLFCLIPAITVAQHFRVTDLGPLAPTGMSTWDQVVGHSNNHAYRWTQNHGTQDLSDPSHSVKKPKSQGLPASSVSRQRKQRPAATTAQPGSPTVSFLEAPEYFAGYEIPSVAVGDINGDGNQDLAVADSISNTINILLGNGDGSFASPASYPVGQWPSRIALADVSGDGILDVLVTNITDGTVSVLKGNGDGTFQAHFDFPVGKSPDVLVVADFNGDQKPDVAVVSRGESSSSVISLLIGNGNGTFQMGSSYTVESFVGSASAGDLNGDGKADLVLVSPPVTNAVNGSVTVLLGNEGGTFKPGASLDMNALAVAIADMDGDGKPDLVIPTRTIDIAPGPGTIMVLLGNGDGTFRNGSSYVADLWGGSSQASVSAGDFDGDGHIDVAVASTSEDTVAVLMGKGDGTFRSQANYGTGRNPLSLVTGDFNGDTQIDLVTTNTYSSSVSVLLGNGDGTFQARPVFNSGVSAFPYSPSTTVAVDFNGDGHEDIVLSDTQSVLLGEGNGLFRNYVVPPGMTPPPIAGSAIVFADFNRDHHPDVATHTPSYDFTVTVSLGNGDGTFQPSVGYAVDSPSCVTTGCDTPLYAVDLRGKGAPDLIAGGALLLNNGDGTFQAPIILGYDTDHLVSADFNGDGKMDLAVAPSDSIVVLLGNGDGTFKASSYTNLYNNGPTVALSLAAADFDGDGRVDLAVFEAGSIRPVFIPPAMTVFFGNGDGTFGKTTTYPFGGTRSIARDFNGDGTPDIVTGATVIVNNGDGTFQPPVSFTAGEAIHSFATADFDGDGKPDIAVSNSNTHSSWPNFQYGTVHILLNGRFALVGLSSAKNPSHAGEGVTFTVNAKSAPPGVLVPTGTVTLQDGKSPLASASLSDGIAVFPSLSLSAGFHQLVARYGGDANFRPGSGGIRQVVVMPDFTVSASSASPRSVYAGQSATATLTINPISGFAGLVTLSCSVSPTPTQAPTCSVNPGSVQVAGDSSQTATLAISTTGPTVGAVGHRENASTLFFALLLLFPAMVVATLRTGQQRGALLRTTFLIFGLMAATFQLGCGGGSGGQTGNGGTPIARTPTGNYTVNILASSGGVTHTTTLTLTVN